MARQQPVRPVMTHITGSWAEVLCPNRSLGGRGLPLRALQTLIMIKKTIHTDSEPRQTTP